MLKDIILTLLIIYAVSSTYLFWEMRKLFNQYIRVTDEQIKRLEQGKDASLTNHRIEL